MAVYLILTAFAATCLLLVVGFVAGVIATVRGVVRLFFPPKPPAGQGPIVWCRRRTVATK